MKSRKVLNRLVVLLVVLLLAGVQVVSPALAIGDASAPAGSVRADAGARAAPLSDRQEASDNIVVTVTSAPVDANGIVGGEPSGLNVFLSAAGADAAHFGDPRFFGHQIPAGGHLEIELGGTFERNGVDNDAEFVAVDSNFYLILLAGNAQNLISEAAGEGVQHGNYTISDDGDHTILVTPNSGEGENGLEGERAAQIGLKTLHILPRRGSPDGPSAWTNGPAGSEGTVSVRIFDADGEMVEWGEGSITFTGLDQRRVAAVNFGLTDPGNPFVSETVHKDVFAASAYQVVAPGAQLLSTQRGETFAAGGPYALRLLLFEAQDKQPDSYAPFMGIPDVGIVVDGEDPSTARLVQDSNGDGALDNEDESIGTVTIVGPNGEVDGRILAPEGWPLTTSGDGVEGPNGSMLNVPVQVGGAAGYYEVTVSLNGGSSATVSEVVEEMGILRYDVAPDGAATFDAVRDVAEGDARPTGPFYVQGSIYPDGTLDADGMAPEGAEPIGTFRCWGWRYDGSAEGDSVVQQIYELDGLGEIHLQGRDFQSKAIIGGMGIFRHASGEALRRTINPANATFHIAFDLR